MSGASDAIGVIEERTKGMKLGEIWNKYGVQIIAAALVLYFCCGNSPAVPAEEASAAEAPAASEETAASADGKTYTVGVCQLVQHEALDAATQGFCDALTDLSRLI